MENFYVDITVKVRADNPERAWEIANHAAQSLNDLPDILVEEVSEAD